MPAASLREISLPRFALRRDEAAASLGISPSTFDIWIKQGMMPKGRAPRGSKIVLWEVEQLRDCFLKLMEPDEPWADDGENPFDHRVV